MKRSLHLAFLMCFLCMPIVAVQASGAGDAIEDAGNWIDDNIIDPIEETIIDPIEELANNIKDAFSKYNINIDTVTSIVGGFTKNFFQGLCNDTICGMFDNDSHGEYFNSWTVKALTLQNRIDKHAPLKHAVLPHTHNSYNSEEYMTAISYLDPNQKISVLNQLNIGIRALEYDIHWQPYDHGLFNYDKEVTLCHNGGQGVCSIWDRLLGEGLEEIKMWFEVPANRANEIVLITFEDHLDGRYSEAVAVIEREIGHLVYKPTNPCDSFSSIFDKSKADILATGKNIILINSSGSSCGTGGYGNYVFKGNWTGTIDETKFQGYPICSDGNRSAEDIQNGYYRTYNDGTLLGQLVNEPMTMEQVQAQAGCGVNSPGPEPIDYFDDRHEAQIWSWNRNEPNDYNNNEDCAEQWSNGRFNDNNCAISRYYACQNPTSGAWGVSDYAGSWSGGVQACSEYLDVDGNGGYAFAVPANGYQNNKLKDAKSARGISSVWVNYSDLSVEGDWQPGDVVPVTAPLVWGVSSNDMIWSMATDAWSNVSGGLKHVDVGSDGTVWGVNSGDYIYRRDGDSWTNIGGRLKQISVGSAEHVWGVNSGDYIYRRDGDSWTNIGGRLKHVSVGADGTVWGVNSGDYIYRRDGDSWTNIGGRLKQISVGSAEHVWGVNSNDDIYQWNGSGWTHISGKLKFISVGADGTVWGVNSNDNIYQRSGNTWIQIAGGLKQVSVGR